MNANQREYLNHLVEKVVGAAYEVSNVLGVGFLERVYERAMVVELNRRGIRAEPQSPLRIAYKKEPVGEYFVDILVERELILDSNVSSAFPKNTWLRP